MTVPSLSVAFAVSAIVAGAVKGPPSGTFIVTAGSTFEGVPLAGSTSTPLTTALGPAIRVSRNVTLPLTRHTR